LDLPDNKIQKKIYNVGYENYKVKDIAKMVQSVLSNQIAIKTVPTDDNRSYHVSSEKIKEELGFFPKHSVEEAILDLKKAFDTEKIPNPLDDIRYYNNKTMQAINLK
jgi:nucleoside-diphosphate-sugar epimerase